MLMFKLKLLNAIEIVNRTELSAPVRFQCTSSAVKTFE